VLVQEFVSGKTRCVNQYHYESRMNKFVIWETTFSAWLYIICCCPFTNDTLQFNHFQCHYVIIQQHFFWRNVDSAAGYIWNYVLGNDNMTVNLWYIIWMNIK